jgi:hypothetical protein
VLCDEVHEHDDSEVTDEQIIQMHLLPIEECEVDEELQQLEETQILQTREREETDIHHQYHEQALHMGEEVDEVVSEEHERTEQDEQGEGEHEDTIDLLQQQEQQTEVDEEGEIDLPEPDKLDEVV